jgi:hypothetical protein
MNRGIHPAWIKALHPKWPAAIAHRKAELSQSLRVAEAFLSCHEPASPALGLIRRTLARDAVSLSFSGAM